MLITTAIYLPKDKNSLINSLDTSSNKNLIACRHSKTSLNIKLLFNAKKIRTWKEDIDKSGEIDGKIMLMKLLTKGFFGRGT